MKRQENARKKAWNHKPGYSSFNGMTPLQVDQMGVIGEMVVAKFLMLPLFDLRYWTYYVEDGSYNVPEIMGVVEVRRVNSPGNPLKLRQKDVDDRAINVKVYIPYVSNGQAITKLSMFGIVQGWEYANPQTYAIAEGEGDSRSLPANNLRSPDTLLAAFEKEVSDRGGWPV